MNYLTFFIIHRCIAIGIAIAKSGEHKDQRYSFWTEVIATAIGYWLLLHFGILDHEHNWRW